RNGTRDGALMVVSRDLSKAVGAETAIAGLRTLQQLLDTWQDTSLAAERIYAELNEVADGTRSPPFPVVDFEEDRCTAPLPRAYQWADGSAYVNHVELVRRARGAKMPQSFWTDPLMYQGGSDAFLGPREAIALADEAWGIDLEGEVAAVTDDVAVGTAASAAGGVVRLVMLAHERSLRNVIPAGLEEGFRLLSRQAVDGVLSRGRDARRAWSGLATGQAQSAALGLRQRQDAGPTQCRGRHDLFLPRAHCPRRQDAPPGRRLDHRLGDRLQQAGGGGRQTHPSPERGVNPPFPAPHPGGAAPGEAADAAS